MKLYKVQFTKDGKHKETLVISRDRQELDDFINYRQKMLGEFLDVYKKIEMECMSAFELYDVTDLEEKIERCVVYLGEILKSNYVKIRTREEYLIKAKDFLRELYKELTNEAL